MHLESRYAHEESRSGKPIMKPVTAQYVADVLTQEALDAFAKLLYAIDIALLHLPFHPGSRSEGRDLSIHLVVPRDVSDEILDDRKRFDREDGDRLVLRQLVHSSLACKTRAAVHLGGTRAALACLAVPAHRQIGRLMSLYVM